MAFRGFCIWTLHIVKNTIFLKSYTVFNTHTTHKRLDNETETLGNSVGCFTYSICVTWWPIFTSQQLRAGCEGWIYRSITKHNRRHTVHCQSWKEVKLLVRVSLAHLWPGQLGLSGVSRAMVYRVMSAHYRKNYIQQEQLLTQEEAVWKGCQRTNSDWIQKNKIS